MPEEERQVVSSAIINRIMDLAGDMPDPAAHRRNLETLNPRQLQERLAALEAPRPSEKTAEIQFWGPRKNRARADLPTEALCI